MADRHDLIWAATFAQYMSSRYDGRPEHRAGKLPTSELVAAIEWADHVVDAYDDARNALLEERIERATREVGDG